MYVLTISDDIGRRWETFVYSDKTNIISIVKSFNNDILDSMVRAILGRSAALSEETYRQCGDIAEQLSGIDMTSDAIVDVFDIVHNAPKEFERVLAEVAEYRNSDEYEPLDCEFDGEFIGGEDGPIEYFAGWNIYDDGGFDYNITLKGPHGNVIVMLEHKDTYDTLD